MGNSPTTKNGSTGLEKKKRYELLSKQEAKILEETTYEDQDQDETHPAVPKARLQRTNSDIDPTDLAAIEVNPKDYKYPFENLVFEGGGNKSFCYSGAIQCLEECGIMPQIKRFGGTSAGAMGASLMSVGYSWEEIYDFLSENSASIFEDHTCGYFSLLPNLIRRFGWNPGNEFHRWMGSKIKAKSATGNPDMTFYDLYKERKIELCVMVTNLSCMSAEYCHPKTTPDMPIRDAVRMSIAIPGIFAATQYDNHGQKDTYVDGGVLCNYPIHCFDGWFLSMEPKDSFILRCQPLKDIPNIMSPSNCFSPKAKCKTLGFLLYDDTEREVMRYSLEKRIGSVLPDKPDKETKLFKKKTKEKKFVEKCEIEHAKTVTAVEKFLQVLHKHKTAEIQHITIDELKAALEDGDFPAEHKDRLFGEGCDLDTNFKILDKDGNSKISFLELISFIEEHGIRMQKRFQGYGRREIDSFPKFLDALQETVLTNLKYVFVGEGDEDRTVGINTGHIGTEDYNIEDADREFARKRGYNATYSYLRYFIVRNPNSVTKKETVTPAGQPSAANDGDVSTGNIPEAAETTEHAASRSPDTRRLQENTA